MRTLTMSKLATARRLSGRQWSCLAEAAAKLATVCAALKLLPFRRAIRIGARPLGKPRSADVMRDFIWAIGVAAKLLPVRAVCIQQGVALQWLLRRHGIDARLHYGVANQPAQLSAHVWVSVDGETLLGGEAAPDYRCVARFP